MGTRKIYQILNWNDHFENAKSRTIRHKNWGSFPNKRGLGYCNLLDRKDGPALYGAFVAVALLASNHPLPRNGYLTTNGKLEDPPWTPRDMAILTKIPEELIIAMLEACLGDDVGWIGIVEYTPPPNSLLAAPPLPDMAQKETPPPPSPPSLPSLPLSPPKPVPALSEEATALCNQMEEALRKCDPIWDRHHPKGQAYSSNEGWGRDARLLLEFDDRPAEEVKKVLEYALTDPFWSKNILSIGKFRQRYLQLKLNMERPRVKRSGHDGGMPKNPVVAYGECKHCGFYTSETLKGKDKEAGHMIKACPKCRKDVEVRIPVIGKDLQVNPHPPLPLSP